MKGKYCPLKFAASSEIGWNCDEKRCAWWVEESEDCSISMLAKFLSAFWITVDNEIERKKKGEKP